ncbi:hypothetical protein GCM10009735_42860 [Actinomadura chokoriensis]
MLVYAGVTAPVYVPVGTSAERTAHDGDERVVRVLAGTGQRLAGAAAEAKSAFTFIHVPTLNTVLWL